MGLCIKASGRNPPEPFQSGRGMFLNDKYTTEQQIADLKKEIEEEGNRSVSQNGGTNKRKVRSIISWSVFLVVVVCLGSLLVMILMAKSKGETPMLFGYQLYVVQSGSMEPTFPIGTVILSKVPKNTSDLQVGQIVTFVDKGITITHRIVEVDHKQGETEYRTKGDNPENSIDPDVLTPNRVKAVFVFRIPLV